MTGKRGGKRPGSGRRKVHEAPKPSQEYKSDQKKRKLAEVGSKMSGKNYVFKNALFLWSFSLICNCSLLIVDFEQIPSSLPPHETKLLFVETVI